jgi:arginine repressor
VRIDGSKIDEIAGTIAGDDTIFIAVKDHEAQARVLTSMAEMFARGE